MLTYDKNYVIIILNDKKGDENDKNKRTETICWTNPI